MADQAKNLQVEHHHSHKKTYVMVFIALAVLTAIEVFIPELDTSYMMIASSLTLLAVAKAWLVAYYFMHLNEESRWMKFLVFIPVFAVVYTVMVVAESIYR